MNRAREKVESEQACRVCGEGPAEKLDAAHLVDRSLASGGYNNPLNVIPLCSKHKGGVGCHEDYDGHRLSILPYLTRDEEVRVVQQLGITRSYKRLTGRAS